MYRIKIVNLHTGLIEDLLTLNTFGEAIITFKELTLMYMSEDECTFTISKNQKSLVYKNHNYISTFSQHLGGREG